LHADVQNLKENNFDMAIAMFNVVNYIENQADLNTFFRAIADKLEKKGMMVFDCWNGIAAVLDPPKIKKSRLRKKILWVSLEKFLKRQLKKS